MAQYMGSRQNLKDMLNTPEMQEAFEIIREASSDHDRVSPVQIGKDGWELEVAERSGMSRGLLRAIDILNELTEEEFSNGG